jgi:hypothetical protein
MCAIGEHLLAVSDPKSGAQERLSDADALLCLPTLQPRTVSRVHPYPPVERSFAPAIIAWGSRQGPVVMHAVKDFTVKTVQKAADLAVHAGSRLYTDSASSYRALKGYMHEFVNHTQKEYARGEVHENRAECLFSLLKPYLRVFCGVSKGNRSGYVGLSVPAELSSAERLRTGGAALADGTRPCHCHQGQEGRICEVLGPF